MLDARSTASRQIVFTLHPAYMGSVKHVGFRLKSLLFVQTGDNHMSFTRPALRTKKQRTAAMTAKPALRFRRRLIPAQRLMARIERKILVLLAYPGNERCAMRALALRAMAMHRRAKLRPHRKNHCAAQAGTTVALHHSHLLPAALARACRAPVVVGQNSQTRNIHALLIDDPESARA